jgi:Thioredoxin
VVEYGDFECPYCGRVEPVVRELLSDFADVRYVWRHLPLTDVHPHTQLAAEAAEAAADQGAFWEMHDLLLRNQDALEFDDPFATPSRSGSTSSASQSICASTSALPRWPRTSTAPI